MSINKCWLYLTSCWFVLRKRLDLTYSFINPLWSIGHEQLSSTSLCSLLVGEWCLSFVLSRWKNTTKISFVNYFARTYWHTWKTGCNWQYLGKPTKTNLIHQQIKIVVWNWPVFLPWPSHWKNNIIILGMTFFITVVIAIKYKVFRY